MEAKNLVKKYGDFVGGQRREPRHSGGRDPGLARPQRRGQDHDHLDGHRLAGAHQRHYHRGRPGPAGRHQRRQGQAGPGAPGAGPLPHPIGTRQPELLWQHLRPGGQGPAGARGCRIGDGGADRAGRRSDRDLLGGHEAPDQHRRRPAAPARSADPGRAHRRRGPAEPQRHL